MIYSMHAPVCNYKRFKVKSFINLHILAFTFNENSHNVREIKRQRENLLLPDLIAFHYHSTILWSTGLSWQFLNYRNSNRSGKTSFSGKQGKSANEIKKNSILYDTAFKFQWNNGNRWLNAYKKTQLLNIT